MQEYLRFKDPTPDLRNWRGLAHLVYFALPLAAWNAEQVHLKVNRDKTLDCALELYAFLGSEAPSDFDKLRNQYFPGQKSSNLPYDEENGDDEGDLQQDKDVDA